jgi:alpha-N-arabinofuranosidase
MAVGGGMSIRHILLASAILLPACQSPESSVVAQDRNLVTNPGFEQADKALPSGWLIDGKVKDRGNLTLDGSVHKSGNRSLLLSPNSRNRDANNPYGVGQQIRVTGLGGKQLQVAAALRVKDGASASVLVFAVAKNGKFIGTVHLQQSEETADFVVKTDSLKLDPATDSIIVACAASGESGRVWFDDISVVPAGDSNAGASTPVSNGSPLRASVEIDTRKVLRKIPKTLYGTNLEWPYDGHGVWDAGKGRVNPDVLEASKQLGLGLVRFPGGVLADYYHWKQGVGPTGSRPMIPHIVDPGKSRNSFGTDELIQYCRSVGAEPLLQVNLITGTPEEAAEWVAYCNRADNKDRIANGYREPHHVRYWELGNEQYMKHGKDTERSFLSPQEYVSRARAFATAMKRVDPSIQLGIVSGVNSGNYTVVADSRWNRTVLEQLASTTDFVAIHNAYAPAIMNQGELPFDDVYRALLAFPVLLAQNLKTVQDEISRYGPSLGGGNPKIAITEWGPLFQVSASSPWVGHTKTLGSAIFAASVLRTMLLADRVDIAAFFKLTERNHFIGWMDQQNQPKPTYYALQMYTRHFGEQVVPASVSSPTYKSRAAGSIAAVANAPYLESIASLNADGSRLYLLVINKHFTSPIHAAISLSGFVPRAEGRLHVLTAASIDANNGNDLPVHPGVTWARQAHAPQGSLFEQGHPGAVAIHSSELHDAAAKFERDFAPLSITVVELTRK